MKKSLREKFNQNVNFVKPLYRKVKFGNRVKPMKKLIVSVDINNTNPCGDGNHVKRKIVKDKNVDCNVINFKTNKNSDSQRTLPGTCESKYQKTYTKFKCDRNESKVNARTVNNREYTTCDLLGLEYGKMEYNKDVDGNTRDSKFGQAKNSLLLIEKIPVTWLRVYPAPQSHDESALSVVFRCVVCQLGLAAFLVLWTILWVFVIHSFEGPYETEVSLKFENEQNQLVIDLATELRQITPLSPKWKNAIERRIEDERLITMAAMARGAKLHPGQFWDLSGTLLFSVYVMTALGFGAPVPQTIWGRTSALIYAVLAVPTQIYLMLNASTCVIAKAESSIERARARLRDRKSNLYGKTTVDHKESPNCSRNSELIKDPRRAGMLRRKMAGLLSILYLGRCVPLATVLYYVAGVVAFGVLRGRAVLETLMFPLEFTTTGGFENVEGPVRIAYGLYVEGAMFLLACALAALRAHSGAAVDFVSDKYRLFTVHERS